MYVQSEKLNVVQQLIFEALKWEFSDLRKDECEDLLEAFEKVGDHSRTEQLREYLKLYK